ncbi:hypothetical protein [Pseudomonas gingeri]|uniref:hypothetical protein n=1 Tax=Pseudomonas gingeri TaxID=117681 RepID=UPI0015A37F90|nr:hypothetical protein [Pseudomonas gingeri]NWA11932.1 hypothetical protein [Pseudomonas gingeri]
MRKAIGRVKPQFVFGLLGGILMASYGFVGGADYNQELVDTAFYCEMVQEQSWPPREGLDCPAPELVPVHRLVSL